MKLPLIRFVGLRRLSVVCPVYSPFSVVAVALSAKGGCGPRNPLPHLVSPLVTIQNSGGNVDQKPGVRIGGHRWLKPKRRTIAGTGSRTVTVICHRPVPQETKRFGRDVEYAGLHHLGPFKPRFERTWTHAQTPRVLPPDGIPHGKTVRPNPLSAKKRSASIKI